MNPRSSYQELELKAPEPVAFSFGGRAGVITSTEEKPKVLGSEEEPSEAKIIRFPVERIRR